MSFVGGVGTLSAERRFGQGDYYTGTCYTPRRHSAGVTHALHGVHVVIVWDMCVRHWHWHRRATTYIVLRKCTDTSSSVFREILSNSDGGTIAGEASTKTRLPECYYHLNDLLARVY